MAPLKTNIAKYNLHIIDADHYYALTVKQSLTKKYGEDVRVEVFKNAEASLEALRRSVKKPQVLLLDYLQNKELAQENGEYAVETIKEISPDTIIVILSNEKNEDGAASVLALGAKSFVVKDQFALGHIYTAIENSSHPFKI